MADRHPLSDNHKLTAHELIASIYHEGRSFGRSFFKVKIAQLFELFGAALPNMSGPHRLIINISLASYTPINSLTE